MENDEKGDKKYTKLIEASEEALKNAIKLSDYYIKRFGNVDFLFEPVKLENYSRSVKKMYGEGFALTGNSSEFLDPVFSSGVAFATESVMLAAKLIHRQLKGETINWEVEFTEYMRSGIGVFTPATSINALLVFVVSITAPPWSALLA